MSSVSAAEPLPDFGISRSTNPQSAPRAQLGHIPAPRNCWLQNKACLEAGIRGSSRTEPSLSTPQLLPTTTQPTGQAPTCLPLPACAHGFYPIPTTGTVLAIPPGPALEETSPRRPPRSLQLEITCSAITLLVLAHGSNGCPPAWPTRLRTWAGIRVHGRCSLTNPHPASCSSVIVLILNDL